MNYHHQHSGIPPGASYPVTADKSGLYPGGFTTSPYPPSQPGLSAAQTQRYPQSIASQPYAMSANPTYYSPPTAYSQLTTAGYPPATQGFHTVSGYPASLQSLPATSISGYPAQYPMPTYLGGSPQLGNGASTYQTPAGLPVTSTIYPSSAGTYSNTPISASQLQQRRAYNVSQIAYQQQSQLGTAPTYPGATYPPQLPF